MIISLIIRKMHNLFDFIDEVLDNEIYSMLPRVDFSITANEIDNLVFPDNKETISITEFTNIVNKTIRLKNQENFKLPKLIVY